MDTGILARVLDDVLEYGGDYRIESLDLGRAARGRVAGARGDQRRRGRPARAHRHAGPGPRRQPVDPGTATTRPAPSDGVFPDDFYSTTNLDTFVRLDREWLRVRPAGDGLRSRRHRAGRPRRWSAPCRSATCRPGDAVVCGAHGVRVEMPPPAPRGEEEDFGFMSSAVSSEKPQALLVRQIAERMREVKAAGQADPLGRRAGRRAHRRGPGDGPAGARRLRRRPLRRQRAGHPRHRVVAVRHLARRRPVQGLGRAARARAPHPRDQHDPRGRLDRGGGGVRRPHRRRHARDGRRRTSRSCWSARCATTARCPTSTPT